MRKPVVLVLAAIVLLAGCRGGDHDEADVAFAQQMIPHHAQALELSDLAMEKAEDPAVRELAGQIEAGQDPEIEMMTGWLEEWGEEVPRTDAHGDSTGAEHAGMLTTEDLDRLAQASGAAFDRMWLEAMITHHDGAIEMAETAESQARDGDVVALAARIAATQQSEVDRMRDLLER